MDVPTTDSPASHKRALSDEADAQFRQRGFEPGEPLHEFYDCFYVKDALASMTESTYSTPIPARLRSEDDDVDIPVIVTRADVQYQPFASGAGETPTGCHRRPDWYFEGWVMRSGFDPFEHITRVRVFRSGTDPQDTVIWQVIPTAPKPSEPLVWAP
jgi:hypothetical protein